MGADYHSRTSQFHRFANGLMVLTEAGNEKDLVSLMLAISKYQAGLTKAAAFSQQSRYGLRPNGDSKHFDPWSIKELFHILKSDILWHGSSFYGHPVPHPIFSFG